MTAQQLNRDIKHLKNLSLKISKTMFDSEIISFKKEFNRLYFADSKFEVMNKKSVLIMFRLNLRFRFHALHSFGIHINLEEL